MNTAHSRLRQLPVIFMFTILIGCSPSDQTGPTAQSAAESPSMVSPEVDELQSSVARMAAVGYAFGGSFSPDGKQLMFISSGSGVPQAWSVSKDAATPEQVTKFADPVGGALFSPSDQRLAVTVAPGGGLNSQIFILHAQGGEPRQITEGGQVNNWLHAVSACSRPMCVARPALVKRS